VTVAEYAKWVSGPNSQNVFFKSVNNLQSYRKSSAQLCGGAIATFLTFIFHTVVQRSFSETARNIMSHCCFQGEKIFQIG